MENFEIAIIKLNEIIKDLMHEKYWQKGFDGKKHTRELNKWQFFKNKEKFPLPIKERRWRDWGGKTCHEQSFFSSIFLYFSKIKAKKNFLEWIFIKESN